MDDKNFKQLKSINSNVTVIGLVIIIELVILILKF